MRYFVMLICLLNLNTGFSQVNKKKETINAEVYKKLSKKINDTVKIKLNDTINIKSVPEGKSGFQVIFLKSPESTDNIKYILPIITLLLGIGINKLLDFFYDRRKVNKAGKRWISELNCLYIPIKKQIDALNSFLLEHNKNEFRIPNLIIYSLLDGEIFKSLDKSDLLKYIENNKIKEPAKAVLASNRVHGFISIMVNHNEQLTKKHEEYLKGVSSYSNDITKGLQTLSSDFAYYGVDLEKEIGKDPSNDPRYKPLLELFNKELLPHLTDGEYNIFELELTFFNPLIMILAHSRTDERVNAMLKSTSNCLIAIKGVKMEKIYFKENIETIINRYEEDTLELPLIISEIN